MNVSTMSSDSRFEDVSGLPSLRDLPRSDRMRVRATAASDVGLRTAAATLVSGALVPMFIARDRIAFDRAQLPFYAEVAAQHDATLSFPEPRASVLVRRRKEGRTVRVLSGGHIEHLSFMSPYVPLNPAMRPLWRELRRNNIAHAQHWRHADGPRPTLIVIHGFFASPHMLNGAFFSLPWFFRAGYDVLLYTLPFHGRRREHGAPFSGSGLFTHGHSGFAEAMGQAIHDLRLFIDYLDRTTGGPVGVTGISLGGYTSALLSCVDPRLSVVIPNVALSDAVRLRRTWFPANAVMSVAERFGGAPQDLVAAATAQHSPLNYPTLAPKPARLIIVGLGDRLAPPEQSQLLWEHWDRCSMVWFPGSHLLHVDQRTYLRGMARFMRNNGFAPDHWLTSDRRASS